MTLGTVLVILIILILLGGSGLQMGGPVYAGGGIGLVLIVLLLLYLLGVFPSR